MDQPLGDAAIATEAGQATVSPWLPPGGPVELTGRGTTFARDTGAPFPGAPTILLLHGWAVTADLNWFPAYPALAEQYRVLSMDHRGHGRGIRPATEMVTLADCADDAVALLDALGIERAVVVGYSMGGAIAQLTWHRHPDRVSGLVLCSTARHFQGGPISDLWYRSYTPLAHLARAVPERAEAIVRRRVDRRVRGDDGAGWMRSELERASPAGLLSSMRSLGRFRSNRWIGTVDVPVSVIVTTKDRTVPTRNQRRLARSLPHASVHEVVGPHDAIITRRDQYLPELVAAIGEVAGR